MFDKKNIPRNLYILETPEKDIWTFRYFFPLSKTVQRNNVKIGMLNNRSPCVFNTHKKNPCLFGACAVVAIFVVFRSYLLFGFRAMLVCRNIGHFV